MQWIETVINTSSDKIDALCDELAALGVDALERADEAELRSFLEENRQYWDYIDERLDSSLRGLSLVRFYFEDSPAGRAELRRIAAALPRCELITHTVRDEDWENNWKQYYKPIPTGERLLIVPEWEPPNSAEGRTVLRLDPGLAFGTGSHATTRMCLERIEKHAGSAENVLDLGCGSGILAISALLLGAGRATGCDIDPKAPKIAAENAALNGLGPDRFSVYAGDILTDRRLQKRIDAERYDLILANIVADVIIALAPAAVKRLSENGVFLCSGIIDGREEETAAALTAAGLTIRRHDRDDGWNCFECSADKRRRPE